MLFSGIRGLDWGLVVGLAGISGGGSAIPVDRQWLAVDIPLSVIQEILQHRRAHLLGLLLVSQGPMTVGLDRLLIGASSRPSAAGRRSGLTSRRN